jgi:hypothetical protein
MMRPDLFFLPIRSISRPVSGKPQGLERESVLPHVLTLLSSDAIEPSKETLDFPDRNEKCERHHH